MSLGTNCNKSLRIKTKVHTKSTQPPFKRFIRPNHQQPMSAFNSTEIVFESPPFILKFYTEV